MAKKEENTYLTIFNIIAVNENADSITYLVETKPELENKNLDLQNRNSKRFGRKSRTVVDIPEGQKKVFVKINSRRYFNKATGKTFFEDLSPDISRHKNMTSRLVKWIKAEKESTGRPNSQIADEIGVSEATIRNTLSQED